jgi:glycine hydroxymethyltransferase
MCEGRDMALRESVFGSKASTYLDSVEGALRRLSPIQMVERVEDLRGAHERWRESECLNMNPAEGLMSRRARRLLDSDMATRLTEGLPGDKSFPHFRQTAFIDEIEAMIVALVRRQFGARFVEWRPVSNSMANAAVFCALLEPHDAVLVQSLEGGGNLSYHQSGPAGLRRLRISTIPPTGDTFEVDPDHVAALAERIRPKMIVIGGGRVLFPYPVRALRAIADRVGALLVYDAAHLGLLISAGEFQRPLTEGAHVVTLSTHKILGGPVGGLVLTDDASIAQKIISLTFPGFLQTRDQNKYSALAVTLAELEQHGRPLAGHMVRNAQLLAGALEREGLRVIGRRGSHTETHQVIIDVGSEAFEWRCQAANILIPDCALSADARTGSRSGARAGTHEVSRLGMQEPEMYDIAGLIARAARDQNGSSAAEVAAEVRSLLSRFPGLRYSFDEAPRQRQSGR